MNLSGKTILLTGAARVGQSVAHMLAGHGARIALTYFKDEAEVDGARKYAEEAGVQVALFQADLSKEADVDRLITNVMSTFGSLDVLVHMAANYPRTPWDTLSEKEWESTLGIIAKSAYLLAKHAGDVMLKNKGEQAYVDASPAGVLKGKMIFFTDWSVLKRPYKEYVPYNVAKSAINGLVFSVAKELAPHITVNAIAPGPILPPTTDFSKEEYNEAAQGTLLGRWGGSEEIACAVEYLLKSDFVTGHILPVDGGRSIA